MGRLSDDEINEALRRLPEWRREGDALVRDLRVDDFAAAIAFVHEVAALAEERNHHPDLLVHGYNQVRVTISTHSEGGITELDVALAGAIDGLDAA